LLSETFGWYPINERQQVAEAGFVVAQLDDQGFDVRRRSLWLATSQASDTLVPE
jgi:hypothetical protein